IGGNTMRATFPIFLVLIVVSASTMAAAAPPKEKDEAPEVIVGDVQQRAMRVNNYDDGRVITQHTAVSEVDAVLKTTSEHGRVVKAGDTITARWSRVDWNKRTIGYKYDVEEKAIVRAYLARQCGGEGFYVIHNAEGLVKIDRETE